METLWDRWPNFSPGELLSPDGLELYGRGIFPLDIASIDRLQLLRDRWGGPIRVNMPFAVHRGWRSPEENRRIYQQLRLRNGGASKVAIAADNRFSFHVAGKAFDISPDFPKSSRSIVKARLDELYLLAEEVGFNGLGRYDTFVHVDNRDGDIARWDSRTY